MARWRRFGTTAVVLVAQVLGVWLLVSTLTGSRRGDLAANQRREGGLSLSVGEVASTTSSTQGHVLPGATTTTTVAATTSSSTTTAPPPTTAPAPATTTTLPVPPATSPSTTTTAPAPAAPCSAPVGVVGAVTAGGGAAWVAGHSDPGHAPALQLSADGGRSFSTVCLPVSGQGEVGGVARRAGRTWVVGSSSNAAFAARSVDGGASWTMGELPVGLVSLKDVDFVDGERGWAVGSLNGAERESGAIVGTSDGGATWQYQVLPVDTALFAVDFVDARHGLAAGVSRRGPVIFTTSNGGERWKEATLPEEVGPTNTIRDAVLLGDNGFAVGDAGILASFDGGETWEVRQRVASEDCCLWSVSFLDPEHGWAVGGGTHGQVYRTSNGGWTWERQATVEGPSLRSVSFADAQRGFAVSDRRPCLYATEDGGTTWVGRRLDGGGACPP
jgi:photosystem II stability/assembly factor-like uncharacterized protein